MERGKRSSHAFTGKGWPSVSPKAGDKALGGQEVTQPGLGDPGELWSPGRMKPREAWSDLRAWAGAGLETAWSPFSLNYSMIPQFITAADENCTDGSEKQLRASEGSSEEVEVLYGHKRLPGHSQPRQEGLWFCKISSWVGTSLKTGGLRGNERQKHAPPLPCSFQGQCAGRTRRDSALIPRKAGTQTPGSLRISLITCCCLTAASVLCCTTTLQDLVRSIWKESKEYFMVRLWWFKVFFLH